MINLPQNAIVDNTMQNREDKRGRMSKLTPVAWLHYKRQDSDVITDAVKHVWGGVAVGREAQYTIPLFTEAQLNQARADALREAAKVCSDYCFADSAAIELRSMAAEIEKG